MKNLESNQYVHIARLSLYPALEAGTCGWSLSTVRYSHGGRVPEIVTEESGRIAQAGAMSPWGAIEAMYAVSRHLAEGHAR